MGIYFAHHDTINTTDSSDQKTGLNTSQLLNLPNPIQLYEQRIQRFAHLAINHPMAEYLNFCLTITKLQLSLVIQSPIKTDANRWQCIQGNTVARPLEQHHLPLSNQWQHYLSVLFQGLLGYNLCLDQTIYQLNEYTPAKRNRLANALLKGEFDVVDKSQALLIWSALSCYYTQLAATLPLTPVAGKDNAQQFCPVCGSYPIASIIHSTQKNQQRYLHCSLCETEWYKVRVKCTNCDATDPFVFYSLDEMRAPIKSECCQQCCSYLKIFYREQDPNVDIVADDLSSLLLDEEMKKIGFCKTGVNPYLFA